MGGLRVDPAAAVSAAACVAGRRRSVQSAGSCAMKSCAKKSCAGKSCARKSCARKAVRKSVG